MAVLRRKGRPTDQIPTSSMADVAFLLLIFFLVTTVFPKDRGLALVMPRDEGPVSEQNVLFLHVAGDGFVDVRQGAGPASFRIPVRELGGLWRARVEARPGLIAALRTRPEAPYGSMVDVLDALQDAGATRISLQMDER